MTSGFNVKQNGGRGANSDCIVHWLHSLYPLLLELARLGVGSQNEV